jgi:hypothetical protein
VIRFLNIFSKNSKLISFRYSFFVLCQISFKNKVFVFGVMLSSEREMNLSLFIPLPSGIYRGKGGDVLRGG